MGAERRDNDPKGSSDPGAFASKPRPDGAASHGGARHANGSPAPAPVDFDALHAALGAPSSSDAQAPFPPTEESPRVPVPAARIGESQGRSSATYSSQRPHTIPPTRKPNEDPAIPAVIVHTDDTVPSAPPAMTTPLAPPQRPPGAPSSGPHGIAPAVGSGPYPATAVAQSSSYPFTPPPFPVQGVAGMHQQTVRMQERPRRARTPTVVVRPRGPTTRQKLLAFILMLLLVTLTGIGVILWQKPELVGLDKSPLFPRATVAPPATTAEAPSAAPTPQPVPLPAATPSTAPSVAEATPSVTATATASTPPPRARSKAAAHAPARDVAPR